MKLSICLAILLTCSGLSLFPQSYVSQTPAGSTVSIFDTATLTDVGALNVGSSNIVVAPNGGDIYAVNSLMGVVKASTVTRLPVASQTGLRLPNAEALTLDAKFLYVAGGTPTSTALNVLDASNLEVLGSFATANLPGYLPVALAIAPGGAEVYQLSEYVNVPPAMRGILPLENIVETIDVKLGKVVSVLSAGLGAAFALSPDGTKLFFVSSANSPTLQLEEFDVTSQQIVATLPVPATHLAFSADGSVLYALVGSQIVVISVVAPQVTGEIRLPGAGSFIVINPKQSTAYVAGQSLLFVVDLARQETISTVALAAQSTAMAISGDGTRLYVSTAVTDAISIADTATKKTVGTVECTGYAQAAVVSADGTRLYALCRPIDISAPTTLISADMVRFERLQSVKINGVQPASYLALSPDGKTVYVPVAGPNQGIGEIQAFDSETLQPTATFRVNPTGAAFSSAQGMAISADGAFLYVLALNKRNSVVLAKVNVASGMVDGEAPLGNEAWNQVVVSLAGDRAYVGGYNGNTQTGQIQPVQTSGMKSLIPYPYCGEYIALTSNATTLYASGCVVKGVDTVYTISTATGMATATAPLQTSKTNYYSMALTPDNLQLYIGTGTSALGTLVLDLASGEQDFVYGPSGFQLAISAK